MHGDAAKLQRGLSEILTLPGASLSGLLVCWVTPDGDDEEASPPGVLPLAGTWQLGNDHLLTGNKT